jgi:hypothetical protein
VVTAWVDVMVAVWPGLALGGRLTVSVANVPAGVRNRLNPDMDTVWPAVGVTVTGALLPPSEKNVPLAFKKLGIVGLSLHTLEVRVSLLGGW